MMKKADIEYDIKEHIRLEKEIIEEMLEIANDDFDIGDIDSCLNELYEMHKQLMTLDYVLRAKY